jgi:hypothetical protein
MVGVIVLGIMMILDGHIGINSTFTFVLIQEPMQEESLKSIVDVSLLIQS